MLGYHRFHIYLKWGAAQTSFSQYRRLQKVVRPRTLRKLAVSLFSAPNIAVRSVVAIVHLTSSTMPVATQNVRNKTARAQGLGSLVEEVPASQPAPIRTLKLKLPTHQPPKTPISRSS